jgi:hypothetical protein
VDAAEPARRLKRARLSVVLATSDVFTTIRRTVVHLARRTARWAIELTLVAPLLVVWQVANLWGLASQRLREGRRCEGDRFGG